MDISKLTHGAKVILIAGIVFLVTSFFHWFEITDTSFGENMWHGIGFLAGLLLIALVVWQAIRLANIDLEIGVTPSMISAALAVLLVLFTFIRFISKPGGGIADSIVDRTIWAWIGLILSIVIAVGAWLNMKALGEGLEDVRDKVQSLTGGSSGGGAAAAAPPRPTRHPRRLLRRRPRPTHRRRLRRRLRARPRGTRDAAAVRRPEAATRPPRPTQSPPATA